MQYLWRWCRCWSQAWRGTCGQATWSCCPLTTTTPSPTSIPPHSDFISYVHPIPFIISYESCTCTLPVNVEPMLEPLMRGYIQSSNMILLTTNNNDFITSLPPTPFIISYERCTCTVPVKVVSMLEPGVMGYMRSSNMILLYTNNDFITSLPPTRFIISYERCTCSVPVKVVSMLEPSVKGHMQSPPTTTTSSPMSIPPPIPFIISYERWTCTVPVKVVPMLEPGVMGYMRSSNTILLYTNNDFITSLPPTPFIISHERCTCTVPVKVLTTSVVH